MSRFLFLSLAFTFVFSTASAFPHVSTNGAFNSPPDSAAIAPGSRISPESVLLLGGYLNASFSNVLIGAEGSLLLRTNKTGRFMIGFTGNYALLGHFWDVPARTDYKVVCSNVGPKFAWRVGKFLYYTLEPTLLFGKETRSTLVYLPSTLSGGRQYTDTEQIKTFQLGTGFTWLLPPDRQGAYISAGIFFRGDAGTALGAAAGLGFGAGFRL